MHLSLGIKALHYITRLPYRSLFKVIILKVIYDENYNIVYYIVYLRLHRLSIVLITILMSK